MSCRSGSSPSTSSTCRSSPADGHPNDARVQRRQTAEGVAVQVDDVPVAACAPVDQADPDAVGAGADPDLTSTPRADAQRGPGGRIHPARVVAVAGADARLAVPAGAPAD